MRKWRLEDNALSVVFVNKGRAFIEVKEGFLKVVDDNLGITLENEFKFSLTFNIEEMVFDKSMERRFRGDGLAKWFDVNWFINSPEIVWQVLELIEEHGGDSEYVPLKEDKLNAAFLIYGSEYDMMLREIDRALDNRDFETLKQLREMVAEIDELQRA